MDGFLGYHSEWNLGSPGGWDYQRITQIIGKAVWEKVEQQNQTSVKLNFDHPLLFPINGFVAMLIDAHRQREGESPGFMAVVAEEETLEDVTENKNLALHLSSISGITSRLMAPHELELKNGAVCWQGAPVSIIFMDFNTDVLLDLHRRQNLAPLIQAVKENRVINPRGTEPINVKSMFEVVNLDAGKRFSSEICERTPWTRRFLDRKTTGPQGEDIGDLVEWTRQNWHELVLKPERGYSGRGVHVGEVNPDADKAIRLAIKEGQYIVQERIPLNLWAEDIPVLQDGQVSLKRFQTDFRCLVGPAGLFGFLGRVGGVPTNVGSGGGVQPLAILESDLPISEAVKELNDAVLGINPDQLAEIITLQNNMALDHEFTYLLGPISIALRPRLITEPQLKALQNYCRSLWSDCLVLEKMWQEGELEDYIIIEEEELQIARSQPWRGSSAIIASDGLFSFGAHPE